MLVRSFAPGRGELAVEVPPGAGALIASTERDAAGWQVLVDGTPQPVQRVNLFFRGVFVPAGAHSVTWLYDPRYWRLLVVVSYGALLMSLVAGVRAIVLETTKGSIS